jgi:hypothetical protein
MQTLLSASHGRQECLPHKHCPGEPSGDFPASNGGFGRRSLGWPALIGRTFSSGFHFARSVAAASSRRRRFGGRRPPLLTDERSQYGQVHAIQFQALRLAVLLLGRFQVHRYLRETRVAQQKAKTFQADSSFANVLVAIDP